MKRDEHGKINKFVFYIQVHSRLKFNRAICIVQNQPNISLRTCTHIYNIYLKKNAIPEMQADDVRTNDSMDKQQQQQKQWKKCEVFIVSSSLLLVHICALCACTRMHIRM